jgi:oxaloacetate decarboxylase (Na+ extruding) subunit alpha
MARIKLVDVSIRDGNQSIWSATGLNTAQTLEIAPLLERIGLQAIDFSSSTHMGIAVRTHKENPWDLLRAMRAATPNTPLQFITTGFRFISWETSSPDFMRLAYGCLVRNGIGRFALIDPMHDLPAFLEAARIIHSEGGEVLGGLTYTISQVHDDAFYANFAGEIAASADVARLYIKDPTGLLTPERARTLIPAVRARIGAKPLELHSHCTIGLAPLTYLAAAELGIEALHVAFGPLSNGTSLPSALRVVANLRELGHTVDADAQLLDDATDYFSRLAAAEGLPSGAPQEYDAAFLRHQLPGGAITTTQRQLEELKLQDRLPAVIEETIRVRAELGYPIMVTPFPQIVCTQALLNVIGKERYANVPDQVIRFVLGRFGRPTAPVDPNVMQRILERPRAREVMAEPPPPSLAELRRKFDAGMSDEEFLLRAVMPADQVDAMLAAGPAPHRYNPDAPPILKLLRELTRRPAAHVSIEKPGFRLTLRTHAHS